MYRCLAILFVLQLLWGAAGERVSAGLSGPAAPTDAAPTDAAPADAAPADAESAGVERDDQEPTLERSGRELLACTGKPVRRIRVKALAVFGASLNDTTRAAATGLERFLNRLNFQTRETTIRQNLLFKEGDPIDPYRFAYSEHILRGLAFIGDARILVEPTPGSADSADVLVMVKELWALTLSASLKEGNRLRLRLADQNLLGLGHQVSVAVTGTPDGTSRLGLDTRYTVPNILGSFVDGELKYLNVLDRMSAGLALSRGLIPHVLKYAGGLELRRTSIEVEDSLATAADNTSDLIDLWAGYPIDLELAPRVREPRRLLFVSGRVRHLKFSQRPAVTSSTFHQYHDTDHFLGGLAFIQSQYYQTTLLYNFGRTEDIPCGFLARITYGLADKEFVQNAYASATLAGGGKSGRWGYAAGELRVGGYPRGGVIELGVLRLRSLYFSHLLPVGGLQLRQFIKAQYTAGIRRPGDDSIDFSGDGGIRGIAYDDEVTGSERLLLNFETVAFTPWTPWGVSFAFFTFADLEVIGSGRTPLLAQGCYSGLGLGVRLAKEAYGIGPLQLRFAWYPRLPVDHAEYSYTAFGETRFQTIDFLEARPDIVEY